MLTFNQYLTELFDHPAPYTGKYHPLSNPGEGYGRYHFSVKDKNNNDHNIRVEVVHYESLKGERVGHLSFSHNGNYGKTSNMGSAAPRVLATVKKIAHDHAKEHNLDAIKFSTEKTDDNSGRKKLYDRITKKMKGSIDDKPSEFGGGFDFVKYSVPTK